MARLSISSEPWPAPICPRPGGGGRPFGIHAACPDSLRSQPGAQGRFRLRAHWSRTRRMVGGVLVDTGPLRRHRDFRRLWGGQLVSQVGSQLTIVAVSYQTYRLTGSTAMVGLVSLGQLVPLLAGSLIGGPLVDAWDRRRVMLFTQFMLAAGTRGPDG